MSVASDNRNECNTILLVEDEDAHAVLIKRAFKEDRLSWVFHHVKQIKDALEWINANRSERSFLVIADYLLPDGNGLDLARNAKSPLEVGYPLVILTGFGSEKLAVQTLKSGAMDYVVKDGEGLRSLPNIAKNVLQKWGRIVECQLIEKDLETHIRSLGEEDYDLEGLIDEITEELESSLENVIVITNRLVEKYGDVLDDEDRKNLHSVQNSIGTIDSLARSLFDCLLPLSFDISLVNLYNAKMRQTKENYDEDATQGNCKTILNDLP